MALRRINPRRRPLLHVPRPFSSSSSSSSNPPFPPPPQPPSSDDPNNASSRSPPGPGDPNPGEGSSPAASSLFLDIRERLRSSPAPPPPRRIPMTPPRPTGHGAAPSLSLDDVRRTLESFRVGSRGAGGASSSAPRSSAGGGGGATPSFQDLLRNSAAPTGSPQGGPNAGGAKSFSFAYDNIRESLRKLGPQQQQQQQRPTRSPFLSSIPQNVFGKELLERAGKGAAGKEEDSGVVLARDYSYEELGKRLDELRLAGAGKDVKEWFSLEELQGRIAKLAELEKKQEDPRFGGQYDMLRSSLKNIKAHDDRKNIKSIQGMSLFANIGGKPMPEYMLHRLPPQEELLERYFHPDHMSSEEKMKLELQKVRDEFKMSENDCGSARVQIAQLTLKIKHLSSVLHKKDKHSRKGLQDMVQRRKKYLKYLRRTDWDSYCLVLSKLGLRDVPEYKAPDYTKTQPASKGKSKKSKRKRKMKA